MLLFCGARYKLKITFSILFYNMNLKQFIYIATYCELQKTNIFSKLHQPTKIALTFSNFSQNHRTLRTFKLLWNENCQPSYMKRSRVTVYLSARVLADKPSAFNLAIGYFYSPISGFVFKLAILTPFEKC